MRRGLRTLASIVLLALAALLVLGAAAANAAPTSPAKSPRASASRPAAKPPAASGSRGSAPRMLDDIHIEGEIPVPQVLFITARDQRRFMEFQHHRYTRTSLELGRGTAMPSRVVVPDPAPAERKESVR